MKKLSVFLILMACTFLLSPAKCVATESDLMLSSKSGLLMDYASGEVLFEKDSLEHLPVASMVKMMTILLALEEYDLGNVTLDTKISTTENASGMGGSQVFIDPYVEYTFGDLLKSVIMASANDASVALAEYFNGNEKSFVGRMNRRAKELGMNDTNYVNCTGLPAPEQYSCARDSAILMREILKYDLYHNYSSIWMDSLTHPSGRQTELVNTNKLIRYFEGCDGGKTGSTNEAGCCLTASARRGDMRLISCIIGAENSKTRFNESSLLLNFGFANFENQFLVSTDSPIATLSIKKGKKDEVEVYANENFLAVVKKGGDEKYETILKIPTSKKAPLKANEKVGSVVVTKDGNIVKEIDIVAKEEVKRNSYFDHIGEIANNW